MCKITRCVDWIIIVNYYHRSDQNVLFSRFLPSLVVLLSVVEMNRQTLLSPLDQSWAQRDFCCY
jgi:hypothetical protein